MSDSKGHLLGGGLFRSYLANRELSPMSYSEVVSYLELYIWLRLNAVSVRERSRHAGGKVA